MNLREIKELIDLVKTSELTELEWERSGVRVRICRAPAPMVRHLATEGAVTAVNVPQGAPPAAGEAAKEVSGVQIRSPIVGTFYRAASPEAPPYVEVGDRVRRGQILCIVEAMKLLNEIESEVDGVVAEILIENARPVEYGEVLFRIEPT
ncbi:MAG TPA: acetyl-CoA carboxylase biotin carboxyl carrier protein [Nitrospiria bacterium]|nr:acetyl-CoA carboxylase biotin carboxyl carrier protein [Nitrospiria bacterium]